MPPGVLGRGYSNRVKDRPACTFPGRTPVVGETWLIVEGVKDAAACHGLGFNAAGMIGCSLLANFEKLFAGCHVILVPDLDNAAYRGASDNGVNC